ncbi:YncE family protein [Sphingomonas nostoxanthinifaciens]|uniref:YncE family protein n=1 Tax=Sphingomonas nostoxanthinifaciens TaxID=2872652 RepID=UPI001CC1FEB6|nr:YncE family protein [Sphingomonas nostoxanthinifaciens]UAK25536.1 YncE family protein [Sphingomonas nostoxanthinifaciens]
MIVPPLYRLIAPAKPSSTSALRFTGFITLPPSTSFLSLFDYMIVEGGYLYAASIKPGTVFKVPLGAGPLPTGSQIKNLAGPPWGQGVAFDPVRRLGFVSRSGANSVDVFDPARMRLIRRISVDAGVDAVVFDPVDRLVYAAHGDTGHATLIDPDRLTIVDRVRFDGKLEFAAFDPTTRRIYQNLNDRNALAVVDLARRQVINQWPLEGCEGPSGMAVDAARHRLFIACNSNSRLAVFDLDRHSVVATLPVGRAPDVVGYDAALHRIYTTGWFGIMSTIQSGPAGRYRVLAPIHLNIGAHTLGIDPLTHRVYIGYASVFSAPRMAVFDAK